MTTISVVKLESLFKNNDINITAYYTMNTRCLFIRCMQRCQPFIIQLDDEIQFNVKGHPKMVPINVIAMDSTDTMACKVAPANNRTAADLEIIKSYEQKITHVNNSENTLDDISDVTQHLLQRYDYKIRLNHLEDDDKRELQDIMRQLERVSLCVKQEKYALCMCYKQYLCTRGPEGPATYKAVGEIFSQYRQFEVVVRGLGDLFCNIKQVSHDIRSIVNGVGEILNMNMMHNINTIKGVVKAHDSVIKAILNIPDLKKKTSVNYNTLMDIVANTNMGRDRIQIEKDAENCQNSLNNLTLATDKILFDNIIAYSTIIKNYDILLSTIKRMTEEKNSLIQKTYK